MCTIWGIDQLPTFLEGSSGKIVVLGFSSKLIFPCIINTAVGGSLCTVRCYVYNVKIPHIHTSAINDVLQHLEEQCKKVELLKNTLGKVHDYLGIHLNFRKKFKVIVTMPKDIQIILETAPIDTDRLAETLADKHLFHVREEGDELLLQKEGIFCTIVANILFMSFWPWLNLKTSISFLMNGVHNINLDY